MIVGQTILSLSPYPAAPPVHGGMTRIHYLNKGLAEDNRLIFVFRNDPDFAPPFFECTQVPSSPHRPMQIFNPVLLMRLLHIVKSESVDIVMSGHMWCGLHGALVKLITGAHFILDNQNVEHLRFKRLRSPLWPFVWALEWFVCHAADRVFCVSTRDREHIASRLHVPASKLTVVPNGVDTTRCRNTQVDRDTIRNSVGVQEGECMALFFGMLDYQPNIEAIRIIIEEIAPRLQRLQPRIRIVVAGPGGDADLISSLNSHPDQISFAGFVEDILAYIKSADVVIAPLMTGSGTRIKIIESIGCGRRVVSTSLGAEGLDRSVLGDLLAVRDDWQAFAQAMVEAVEADTMTPSKAFAQAHDWQNIVRRMCV